jgi:TRAP-type C4-dicarboxylate transport system permease small subunit
MRMRKSLDLLYDVAVWLAATLMIGVLVMVLLSIFGRMLNFHVRGTDAYAGYCMAGAGFLALAHTLKKNEHIRVTLLLNALHGASRRGLEIWALTAAMFLAGLFAYFSVRLAYQSFSFNDVSTSNDATPLWIPQLSMALGSVILLIAFIDEWVLQWRGERKPVESEEALHNE